MYVDCTHLFEKSFENEDIRHWYVSKTQYLDSKVQYVSTLAKTMINIQWNNHNITDLKHIELNCRALVHNNRRFSCKISSPTKSQYSFTWADQYPIIIEVIGINPSNEIIPVYSQLIEYKPPVND